MFDPVLFAALMGSTALFSPSALFSSGEQGVWYDPSDFTTMFQDAAGTTPVTAVEQPVGRILDKSGRGNHASQSTAASRPVLSARVNLLTYSEAIASSFVTGGTTTLTDNQAVTPSGAPATRLVPTTGNSSHAAYYPTTFGAGTFTFSLEVKAAGYPRIGLRVYDSVAYRIYATIDLTTGLPVGTPTGTVTTTDLGDGWWKISVQSEASTSNMGSTTGWVIESLPSGVTVQSAFTGDGTSGMFVSKVDIRLTNIGVGIPTYQRIAAATDYDTSGFPLYLRFDGTDDSLATGSINPGSVDKVQVFSGLRKVSDAAVQIPYEFSTNSSTSNGSFGAYAGLNAAQNAAGPYPTIISRGTAAVGLNGLSYPAPSTYVQTQISDISAPSITLRLNSVQAGISATSQGTGNFLAYSLYIGARSASSLWFNGNLYSLIVRFSAANLSDAQIASTETYVNNLTKAY